MGLILGLFTEMQLKLVAGVKPEGLLIAVVTYPILVTASYLASRLLDRRIRSTWRADLSHYFAFGVFGMAFEWFLLGNGPGSNANQLGMWAMWTTFGFGPRVLTRALAETRKLRRNFWIAFGLVAVALTVGGLLIPASNARIVVVILALVGSYVVWSLWLLVIAWRGRGPLAGRRTARR